MHRTAMLVAIALLATACGSTNTGDRATDAVEPAGPSTGTVEPATRPPSDTATTPAGTDALPPIVVTAPVGGDVVSTPVNVAGTANVFEATVSIRVLDARGREIARTFTTATCGTGCRGSYSEEVAFEVTRRQSGTVEVFEESAEDGSALHVVTVPVTLSP